MMMLLLYGNITTTRICCLGVQWIMCNGVQQDTRRHTVEEEEDEEEEEDLFFLLGNPKEP
jgi:hypothetical protein